MACTLRALVGLAVCVALFVQGNAASCDASRKLKPEISGRDDRNLPDLSGLKAFNVSHFKKRGATTYVEDATCFDGKPFGYMYDEPPGKNSEEQMVLPFVIFLGDSTYCSGKGCDEACSGSGVDKATGICEGFDLSLDASASDEKEAACLYARATCTSDWWVEKFADSFTPETILCHQHPTFGKFKRVFIPTCTMDNWIGKGSGTNKSRHRGHDVLNNVLHDLAFRKNLTYASKIVFVATRFSGVGLMNNIKFIRDLLKELHPKVQLWNWPAPTASLPPEPTRTILSIIDSAWEYDTEKFAPSVASQVTSNVRDVEIKNREETKDFLEDGELDAGCKLRWGSSGQLHKCLLASELLLYLKDEKILFIQSQFDMVHLSRLNLLNQSASAEFVDDVSFASGAVGYIENYGQNLRASIEDAAFESSNSGYKHFFFLPPCAQHSYLVPLAIASIAPQSKAVGTFGTVSFRHDFSIWSSVALTGFTVENSIVQFVTNDGNSAVAGPKDAADNFTVRNNVRTDACGTFLCNSNCPTRIVPFRVEDKFSECSRTLVLVYGASVLLLFYAGFALSYSKILAFRRTSKRYWARIKMIEGSGQGDKKDQLAEVQMQLLSEANAQGQEYRKVHLMVENLSYWAPAKRRGKPHQILSRCNLTFAPGHVHAIMGPSGSGKSTLLDILALARDSGQVSGAHYINGVNSQSRDCEFLREWLVLNSSYVRQQDVLFPRITVREHLVHSAWLMLPQFMSAESKLRRVRQVIRLLELDACADTICGDGGVTVEGGISGGQRRRVSVATQLLKMPVVLLLDEPTSGLDSTNALLLCKALHSFAHDGGVNVLMTIHQPRKEIFDFLDTITFLVAGRVMFSGRSQDAATHFKLSPSTTNIANAVIDKLQESSQDVLDGFMQAYSSGPLGKAIIDEMSEEITDLTAEQVANLKEVLVENSLAEGRWSWTMASSSSQAAWVLMSRTFKRGGFDIKTTIPMALVGGILVGFVFFETNYFASSYTGRVALNYLAVATMTFLQGTFLGDRYLGEKHMYDHESEAGTFRNWIAFLLSQFMRDAVTSSLEGIAFAVPCYWIGGLNPDPMRFAIFLLLMVLTSFVVVCQNVFIEIDRNDLRTAAMLQIGLLGLGALFNGFIIKIDDIPLYWAWVPYIMVTYWSFVGTLINDLSYFALPFGNLSVLETTARTGDNVIRSLSYDNQDIYVCITALAAFVAVFRTLGVLDFYFRYVRNKGNTLKTVQDKDTGASILRGDSYLSATGTPRLGKNTMANMLDAKTPTLQRQQSELSDGPGSPQFGKLPSISSPGSFSLAKEGEGGLGFYEDQGTEKFTFVQSGLVSLLLDRNLLLLWFLVDFYCASYICAFQPLDEDIRTIAMYITGGLFASVWVAFFFFQLILLTPTTLDGQLDCTWAGGYDATAAMTLVVDLALTFQLASPENDFLVAVILTMIVRSMRFLRVIVYWGKVDMYHEVRARSFLDLREQLVEEEALLVHQQKSKRISDFDLAGGNKGPAPPRPQRPNRPPRPGMGGGSGKSNAVFSSAIAHRPTSIAMKRTSAKLPSGGFADAFGAPPVPASRGPVQFQAIPKNQKPARPAARSEATGSFSSSQPPSRPVAPQRPAMPNFTASGPSVTAAELGPMWRPAGQGAFYNSMTGQVLTVKQINTRRAPPPPPQ